jgi:O-antigen biosynthesis protein
VNLGRALIYTIDIRFNIAQPIHRRNKRVFDLGMSVFLLCVFPILVFFIKNKIPFIINVWSVLVGNKTWVAYALQTNNGKSGSENLPKLKRGVFSPLHAANLAEPNVPTVQRLNFLYAKDYDVWRDAEVVWKGFKNV